jgi:broad specificity phosphatase PhoE
MALLILRHAEKEFSNGKGYNYRYDPGLTEKGKQDAEAHFKKLIKIHGIPSKLFCSPFLRTRQTAKIAKDIIYQETGIVIKIIHMPLLGEYLGNHKDINPYVDINEETLKHQPIFNENFSRYKERVMKFSRTFKHENVWVITHGLFISLFNISKGGKKIYPQELTGLILKKGEVIEIN